MASEALGRKHGQPGAGLDKRGRLEGGIIWKSKACTASKEDLGVRRSQYTWE